MIHYSPEQYSHSPELTILPQWNKDRSVANRRDPASFVHPRYLDTANNALDGAGPSLPGQASFFKLEVLGIISVSLHFTADFHHLQTSVLHPLSTFPWSQASTHNIS